MNIDIPIPETVHEKIRYELEKRYKERCEKLYPDAHPRCPDGYSDTPSYTNRFIEDLVRKLLDMFPELLESHYEQWDEGYNSPKRQQQEHDKMIKRAAKMAEKRRLKREAEKKGHLE